MESFKKNLPVILITMSCTLFFVAVLLLVVSNNNIFSLKNSTNSNTNNASTNAEVKQNTDVKEDIKTEEKVNTSVKEEVKAETKTDVKEEVKVNTNTNTNTNTSKPEVKQEPKQESTPSKVEEPNSELSVVKYFEQEENRFNDTSNKDSNTLGKLKSGFTSIIDFIFYDKEIKGYTFKGLTNSAKLKIISLALAMDNKIDSYFPDYKYTIKEKYTDFKGKLAVKYLEFTASLCESVGADTCNQAKEDFNTMKSNFSLTFSMLKELAKSGSSKVKEFYESWRDN